MIFVYIVTKEGRAYSDEGLRFVTDQLQDNYKITDELTFIMGESLNNPKYLSKKLDSEQDKALVVSIENGVFTLYDKSDIQKVIRLLNENQNQTSWQTLSSQMQKCVE